MPVYACMAVHRRHSWALGARAAELLYSKQSSSSSMYAHTHTHTLSLSLSVSLSLSLSFTCRYYNWRQDGFSDLLLVTGASASFMLSAALIKRTFIDTLHGDDPDGMGLSGIAAAAAAAASGTGDGGGWLSALLGDLYSVMVLTFGENLAPPGVAVWLQHPLRALLQAVMN